MKAMLRVGWRGALPVALALTAFAALPAQAAAPRTIAGFGSGAGRVNNPEGVAVDQAGKGGVEPGTLYVADLGNRRVDRFGPAGDFQLAWGYGVADGVSEELQVCGPAAEPEPTKRCFATTFDLAHGGNSDNNLFPRAVAVGQSTSDVYVAEPGWSRVSKFTPSGALLFLFGPDVTFSGPGNSGADETKTLTVKATAGAFALSLTAPVTLGASAAGQTTAPIPYNASAAEVQAALEALANVEPGDLSVTGGPGDAGGSSPYQVAFSGGPYIGNIVQMSAGSAGLGGGTAALATAAPGGGPEVCEPGRGDLCKAAAGPGAVPGELIFPRSLAFDPAGKLWVNDRERALRFDADGAFFEQVPLPAGTGPTALAIDPVTSDFYVLGPQGSNEEQKLSLATSGAFTLTFEGQSTAPIAAGGTDPNKADAADAEAIQAALEALSTIGPGNVSVEPSAGKFKVVFIHNLGGRDLPQLAASGGSPPVTVTTESNGAPGSVRRLDPTGALLETLYDAPGDLPAALVTDAAGNLYVGDANVPYALLKFDSSGEQLARFGAGELAGNISANGGPQGNALALDEATLDEASGSLYAAGSGEGSVSYVKRLALPAPGPLPREPRAEDVLPTTATFAASLNPEGDETAYRFQYLTQQAYEENLANSEPPFEGAAQTPEETLPESGFEEEDVSAAIEGLIPATEYRFRILAENEAGETEAQATFTTRTAVGIEAQWATDIAARSAILHAELDPLGVVAHWKLEYGTSAGYGSTSAEFELPATFGAAPVAIALTGLSPATTYHYHFVASDKRESTPYTTYGSDRTFTTQLAGLGFALPDDRAWEMVSPPEKHGGRIAAPDLGQGGQVQAAADGEALAYLSYGSLEANPEGNRLIEQSSELAKRAPGGAWSTRDITPPHTTVTPFAAGTGLEYKLFSANLGRALLEPRDCTLLSPAASERTPYLRQNAEPPTYTPLVSAKEGFSDVAPSTPPFGGDCADPFGKVSVQGASADLGHVVLGSDVPLAAGSAPLSLYEWAGGALLPLSVPLGGGGAVGATLGSGEASVRGAVSEDGSRVFWTSGGGLYLRDSARGETVRLDEVKPDGFGTGKVEPLFQAASADGSVAFFTDTQNLTEDANEEGADLYRCEVVVEGGTLECDLSDLSAGVVNLGESAAVEGLPPGIGEDGSSAYLVARGVLATNDGAAIDAATGEREKAAPGQPNLYAWHQGEGVRFVARLSGEDERDWGDSPNSLHAAWALTAAASPSGRYLAFMSERPLTGYDNRDATGGERAQEVFRYDAQTEELACVSCKPSGARPRALVPGPDAGQLSEEFDPNQLWSGKAVAAVLPEATKLRAGTLSLYTPRYIHDDGRVFFNAADSLVPADSNGDGDVYEFESTGTGTCTPASGDAGTATVPGGCVSLISSGTAEDTAAFLDASEGARDVFFYTPARLSVTDEDSELDVYDAREEGIPARLEPSAECLGEACQPPASPPPSQTPASAAFQGPGNLSQAPRARCPKGRRQVRRKGEVRCVKRAHTAERRGHRHHRDGRAGR